MKHIYKLFALTIGAIFLFSSCSLDRSPYNYFTKEELEKEKESSFKYMINGCYSQLKDWSDEMHRVGEYPGDNIMIRGVSTDAFFPFISYQHIKDNRRLYTFWENSYRTIVQASDAIALMEEGTSDDFDYNLGEAYYMRGMVYFYLTRVFGRPYYDSPEKNLGVPIVLKGSPNDLEEIYAPDRSTVKECYEQAIKDLKEGERLMKGAINTPKKSAAYASPEAAQAMLSRIYLYMSGPYDQVNAEYAQLSIDYANQVINSNKYIMLPRGNFMKYNEYEPDNPIQTETVFAVKRVSAEFSGSDHYYGIGGMYANILGKGWGEMYATSKYMDLLKKAGSHKEDARWAFIDPQYQTDKITKKPIDGFRFIADLKDQKTGALTGYGYIQDTLRVKANGSYFIKIFNADLGEKGQYEEFPLTTVDEPNRLYSITYKGKTYTGEKDYVMLTNNGHPMFYVTKCSMQSGESHLHSPIISRLAEMYLNLAEAHAKKGEYGAALTSVNTVRERSVPSQGYASLDATNAEQLIEEERQLELAYEAHRAFDVFRNKRAMKRHYPGAHNALADIEPNSPRVVHYIPQKEINAYPGVLTQNPD